MTRLSVTHWYTAQRLKALGITVGRGNISKAVKNIPDDLIHHFIRGLFDGDGCAVSSRPELTLAGHPDTLSWLRDTFHLFINTSPSQALVPNIFSDRCYSLWYGGKNQVQIIAKFMYRDASIWLERKRAIIKSY